MNPVLQIDERPDLLPEVIALGKANRATLGFLPEGAFIDHTARGWILVVPDAEGDELLGYLLYRVVQDKATITHLCVGGAGR